MVEAMNIIRDCTEGSGVELRTRVEDLQNQFDGLCESCYEAKELCEEATAAIQVSPPLPASSKNIFHLNFIFHFNIHLAMV